jgi:hypothetical protein
MTIIRYQKNVTNVIFAIFTREIFHAYFKYCNIWLNVLIDLSCIEAYNALLYSSAGNKNKNTEDPDKTTNRQKCLSYICIVIFQQRESLRSDPEAFLI